MTWFISNQQGLRLNDACYQLASCCWEGPLKKQWLSYIWYQSCIHCSEEVSLTATMSHLFGIPFPFICLKSNGHSGIISYLSNCVAHFHYSLSLKWMKKNISGLSFDTFCELSSFFQKRSSPDPTMFDNFCSISNESAMENHGGNRLSSFFPNGIHKTKMALVTLVDYLHWDLDGSTAFVLVPLGFFTPFGTIIHGIHLDLL